MGMGVVTQDEFEQEYNDCVSHSVPSNPKSEYQGPTLDTPVEDAPATHETPNELDNTPEVESKPSLDVILARIESVKRGRSEGDKNVPDSMRKILGATSEIEGRQEAIHLARMFGVSDSSVSAYANGATSTKTYHEKKPDIVQFITSRKNRITKKALHRIASAIDKIDDEKLEGLGAKDLATVAKDMSSVVKHMEPEQTHVTENNGPKFVIYAPTMQQENNFEIVHVNE